MATEETHRTIAPLVGPDDERVFTDSGIEIERVYDADDVAPGLEERLGEPGAPPFTRGIPEGMYRDRLWPMRPYAGFATPEEMRICFDQIPLDSVSTSMTINAPAAVLLLLYELVGEEQGVPSEKLRGTV